MAKKQGSPARSDQLPKIGAPATRALEGAGYTRLPQLNGVSEADLAELHGVGPKAIRILRAALADAGYAFGSKPVGTKRAAHPLVLQLRFTRKEFLRSVLSVSEEDAQRRVMPMNCLSWNVGHLAWQEQRYFLHFARGQMPLPEIDKQFAFGCPASTPALKDMLAAWRTITKAADPWLDDATSTTLQSYVMHNGKPTTRQFGNLLQRVIYHYWYHTGENMAIRQMLGHKRLGVFVGNIDDEAPYQPE
jgi:uncharacterized damage-inducible protein DinB